MKAGERRTVSSSQTKEDLSSFADKEIPFTPIHKYSKSLITQIKNDCISLVDSDITSATQTLERTTSDAYRIETLFKECKNDDNDCDCEIPRLHGPHIDLKLSLTPREVDLIKESWKLILNDNLRHDDLVEFSQLLSKEDVVHISSSNPNNSKSRRRSAIPLNSEIIHASSVSKNVKESEDEKIKVQPHTMDDVGKSLFCTQFYESIIETDPYIKHNYPSIRHQAVSFTLLLQIAVDNLDDIKVIDNRLRSVAKRHTRILGVDQQNFEVMGVAFLATISDRFAQLFTRELEYSWSQLYSYLANCLIVYGVDPVLSKQVVTKSSKNAPQISFEEDYLEFSEPEVIYIDADVLNKDSIHVKDSGEEDSLKCTTRIDSRRLWINNIHDTHDFEKKNYGQLSLKECITARHEHSKINKDCIIM